MCYSGFVMIDAVSEEVYNAINDKQIRISIQTIGYLFPKINEFFKVHFGICLESVFPVSAPYHQAEIIWIIRICINISLSIGIVVLVLMTIFAAATDEEALVDLFLLI